MLLVECATDAEALRVASAGPDPARLVLPFRHRQTAETLLTAAAYLEVAAEILPRAAIDPTVTALIPLDNARAAVTGVAGVLALGGPAVPLALLFGRLTGRPVVAAEPAQAGAMLAEVRDARSLTVVTPPRWGLTDLVAFQDLRRATGCATPIGYLYPYTDVARELFALKSVLFSTFHRSRHRYQFRYPLENRRAAFRVGDSEVVIGNAQSAEAARESLTAPTDFLFATPHSNGVNMSLGPIVLCAREDRPAGAPVPERTVPCFSGAPCSRKRPGNLIAAPSTVRSTVAFLYTCQGVLLDDGTYHVADSLAARFAASPYTAALLSTPGLSLLDRAGGPFVADLIRAGTPLGAASALFNRRHLARYADTEEVTVLFGDPELTMPGTGGPLTARLSRQPEFADFAAATGLRWYHHDPADDDPTTVPEPVKLDSHSHSHSHGTDGDSDSDGNRSDGDGDGENRANDTQDANGDGNGHISNGNNDSGATATPTPGWTYAAVDYARCVVAGSRAVGHPALSAAIEGLAHTADQLWPVLLATDARVAQAAMAGTPASLLAERDRRIGGLQQAWVDYFQALVATLGGYLRLQTDRYFRPSGLPRPRTRCPNCDGIAHEFELRQAGGTAGRRTLVECVGCATVLDALPPVRRARLAAPARIAAGAAMPLRLAFTMDRAALDLPIVALAVLEPFHKGVSTEVATSVTRTRHTGPATGTLTLPPLSIPPDLFPGVYFINAILLAGAAPSVLRRSIVVTSLAPPELPTNPQPEECVNG